MLAPKDRQGNVEIILIDNKSGKEKARKAEMFQKGPDKRLYRYTFPESQAGIASLSLPDGIMWLYLPAFGKPKKISLLAKSQKFTGTDFSYEDMDPKPYSERYTPTLKEITDEAFILELIPISEKSKYSKLLVLIHNRNYYPILMEYYDKKDRKIKEANYIYKKTGNYWNAEEVKMTDLKKNHSTKILLHDVVFDQGLSDDLFTVENMKVVEEE